MMGEYIIYYQGKVIGGIYDNRFLVKKTKAAKNLMPDAPSELPYEGGKEMLLVDVDDADLLNRLIPAVALDLPAPKKKKRSGICFWLPGNPRVRDISGSPALFFPGFPVFRYSRNFSIFRNFLIFRNFQYFRRFPICPEVSDIPEIFLFSRNILFADVSFQFLPATEALIAISAMLML